MMAQLGFGELLLPRVLGSFPGLRYVDAASSYYLVQGEAIETLRQLPDGCADLIFADPPYRLSNGGTTCSSGERVPVDKGEWDASGGLAEDHAFNSLWLREARRVLKPTGTIWVSGSHHIIFSIGFAMQEIGYHVLNFVQWFKPSTAPNFGCRQFTHSVESIVWSATAKRDPMTHVFHYDEMREEAGGVQMRDFWQIPTPGPAEKTHGHHPTQKPLRLLKRIVWCCTNPGDFVVDPFCGSSTTGVAAVKLGRRYLGVDLSGPYIDLSARRLGHPGAPPAPPPAPAEVPAEESIPDDAQESF